MREKKRMSKKMEDRRFNEMRIEKISLKIENVE